MRGRRHSASHSLGQAIRMSAVAAVASSFRWRSSKWLYRSRLDRSWVPDYLNRRNLYL